MSISIDTAQQELEEALAPYGYYFGLPEKIRLGHLLAETLVISFHFQVLCLGKCKVKSAETSKTR